MEKRQFFWTPLDSFIGKTSRAKTYVQNSIVIYYTLDSNTTRIRKFPIKPAAYSYQTDPNSKAPMQKLSANQRLATKHHESSPFWPLNLDFF